MAWIIGVGVTLIIVAIAWAAKQRPTDADVSHHKGDDDGPGQASDF